jgi:ferric-dicitrate binding protein FerR (iron transport regulator)
MERFDYQAFFEKYLQNRHSSEEHEQFVQWFGSIPSYEAEQVMEYYRAIAPLYSPVETPFENDALIRNIEARLDQTDPSATITEKPVFSLWTYLRRISAAAVFVLLGFGTYYLFVSKNNPTGSIPPSLSENKIVPASGKAMLTLADGSEIDLSKAVDGQIASQSDIQIYKVNDGELVYSKQHANHKIAAGNAGNVNRITTPKAGQFQISLSDGTKVWLNSLSSIRFPAIFAGKERRVEITGEVYFEVAKFKLNDRHVPFIVVCDNQLIEVLGTHFNVNAYKDEGAVKTTLLEGSVKVYPVRQEAGKVSEAVRLKPGEQSILKQTKANAPAISVEKADTEIATAWQKGYFKFHDTDIQEVMRQLSRWYDLEVVYKGPLPQDQFTGYVSKKVAITNVLNILEEGGGVKFNVNENRVEVQAVE